MILVYEETGEPVQIGDVIKTFRDETVEVRGIEKPHKAGSTGRVYVIDNEDADFQMSYFPSVIGAVWRDEK